MTCEDLEGFWDLVMIQVSDVETLFAELTLLRNNGWKESKTQVFWMTSTKLSFCILYIFYFVLLSETIGCVL